MRSSRPAGWSSRRRPRSAPTESTQALGTLPATASASHKCARWPRPKGAWEPASRCSSSRPRVLGDGFAQLLFKRVEQPAGARGRRAREGLLLEDERIRGLWPLAHRRILNRVRHATPVELAEVVRAKGVRDARVLEALKQVPRAG